MKFLSSYLRKILPTQVLAYSEKSKEFTVVCVVGFKYRYIGDVVLKHIRRQSHVATRGLTVENNFIQEQIRYPNSDILHLVFK